MRQKKAKMLRRLSRGFAAASKVPEKTYQAVKHQIEFFTLPVTPEEIEEAKNNGTGQIRRMGESVQIILGHCQRRMYQVMKNKYMTVGWR